MRPEFIEIDKFQGGAVSGFEADRAGDAGPQGFGPSRDADAPRIARFKTREIPFRSRRAQVVAGLTRKRQEFLRDMRADGVQADIAGAGAAITIAVKSGARRRAAQFQRLAKDIGGHGQR